MSRRCKFAFISMLAGIAEVSASTTPPPVATLPYRAAGSTVLLPVSVNGKAPGWFILDSGANSCVLSKAFARSIGLRPAGTGAGTGAGRGPVPYDRFTRSVSFKVGGLPLSCPTNRVIGLDLNNQPAVIGVTVDGILGTDFFAQYVVEIDYANQIVRAYDPATFRYTGNGCRAPFTVDSRRLPLVTARLTVDGDRSADRILLLDTGSQDAIDDDWVEQASDLRTATGGVGLGQTFETRGGRFTSVRIGCFTISDVPGYGGGVPLVGGEFLRHFTLIFDWPRRTLILEANAGFARSLADSGVGGLSLRRDGALVRIDSVGSGTPAASAGLKAGDLIERLDGTPVSAFTLDQLGQIFRRARSYRMDIVRGSQKHTIILAI